MRIYFVVEVRAGAIYPCRWSEEELRQCEIDEDEDLLEEHEKVLEEYEKDSFEYYDKYLIDDYLFGWGS